MIHQTLRLNLRVKQRMNTPMCGLLANEALGFSGKLLLFIGGGGL